MYIFIHLLLCPMANEKYSYTFLFCANTYFNLHYYFPCNDAKPDVFPTSVSDILILTNLFAHTEEWINQCVTKQLIRAT